jgi:hypothetical protein
LNTKLAVNELSFPLVTHTVNSDAWFHSYRVLKSRQCVKNFLDKLDKLTDDQALRAEDMWILTRVVNEFHRPLTQLSNAYSNTYFQ